MAMLFTRGRIFWIDAIDHQGNRRRLSTRITKSNRRAAQLWLTNWIREQEDAKVGLGPNPEANRKPIPTVLEEFLGSKKRDESYVHKMRAAIVAAINLRGWTKLAQVDAGGIEAYLDSLDVGPKTWNNHRGYLSSFLGWCCHPRRRLLRANPCDQVELKDNKATQNPRRALSYEEIARICEFTKPRRADIYWTAAYTGLRRSELSQLTPAMCIFDDSPHLSLPGSITKSGLNEMIPLVPMVVEILWRRASERARICEDEGAVIFSSLPDWRTWDRDLARAGISKVTGDGSADFHSLRHSLDTMLAAAGVSLWLAQKILRHQTPAMTANRYNTAALLPLREEMAKLPGVSLSAPCRGEAAFPRLAVQNVSENRGAASGTPRIFPDIMRLRGLEPPRLMDETPGTEALSVDGVPSGAPAEDGDGAANLATGTPPPSFAPNQAAFIRAIKSGRYAGIFRDGRFVLQELVSVAQPGRAPSGSMSAEVVGSNPPRDISISPVEAATQ